MNFGNSLFKARKRSGLSQEEVADKLGVSRQTVSKWENGETLPDILQSKKLSSLFHMTIDGFFDFDSDQREVEQTIANIDERKEGKIDWTKAWGKRYPVLLSYQNKVDIPEYARAIRRELDSQKPVMAIPIWTRCSCSRISSTAFGKTLFEPPQKAAKPKKQGNELFFAFKNAFCGNYPKASS